MNKIDISSWKDFHLEDIFEIDSGTKLDKIKMKTENPTINFVGRANVNNGVTTKVDKIENLEPYKAGNLTLALGGSYLGSCFIQKEPFYTSQNVVVLIPKEKLSFYTKQFIASVIFVESQLHYKAFLNELNPHIKTDFTFKLPINKDGQPDYSYMDAYMSKKFDMYNNKFKIYKEITVINRKNIDVKNWKEYKIKDLFYIRPTKNYKLTNNKLFETEGQVPVVVNSSYNNGIGGYVSLEPNEQGNIITFSDTTSCTAVFYQPADFIGYSHIQGMYPIEPEKWSKYSMLFLLSVFKKAALLLKYDYVNKFTRESALEMNIKLPTNDGINPDFNYMEEYIKNKFEVYREHFESFNKI